MEPTRTDWNVFFYYKYPDVNQTSISGIWTQMPPATFPITNGISFHPKCNCNLLSVITLDVFYGRWPPPLVQLDFLPTTEKYHHLITLSLLFSRLDRLSTVTAVWRELKLNSSDRPMMTTIQFRQWHFHQTSSSWTAPLWTELLNWTEMARMLRPSKLTF